MVEDLACEMGQGSSTWEEPVPVSRYFELKAIPTRIIGALLLVVASPLIVLLVLLVRATSPGAGLYRQTRTGRNGKEFQMYKIRTMYQDAESVSGPTWCKPGDSRITPVGRILRLLHLDELPQLINIVRGEMDLIGPRPERPSFVEKLAIEIPGYRDRLRVLPGVTGLAQVNLPPDETLDCVRKKLVLDREYIKTASIGLDIKILICTSLRMLGIRHGRSVRMFRLERNVTLPPEAKAKPPQKRSAREEVVASPKPQPVLSGNHATRGPSGNGKHDSVDDVYAGFESEPAVTAIQTARRPR